MTLIANYVPLQEPAGGPNFFEFGDDVLYEIHIDNTGSGTPAITYQFNFTTTITDPGTFLYATGPITSLTDSTWNRRQTYTVTKVQGGVSTLLTPTGGSNPLSCPPCNIGPRSTPNYSDLSGDAVYRLSSGEMVFAGQRAEGFFVDLGSIFDLGDLRPLSPDQLIPGVAADRASTPLPTRTCTPSPSRCRSARLTSNQMTPRGPNDTHAVIGVWTTASRQTVTAINPGTGTTDDIRAVHPGVPAGQPAGQRGRRPDEPEGLLEQPGAGGDSQFAAAVEHPELQALLPVLYPGAFPHLAAYSSGREPTWWPSSPPGSPAR